MTVWATDSPDGTWTEVATGPRGIETLHVDAARSWWVAVHGGAVSRTDDQGVTWLELYIPPTRP